MSTTDQGLTQFESVQTIIKIFFLSPPYLHLPQVKTRQVSSNRLRLCLDLLYLTLMSSVTSHSVVCKTLEVDTVLLTY